VGLSASPTAPQNIVAASRNKAFEALTTLFDEGELRAVAFGLLIDFDDLAGDTKTEKAQSLVEKCERYGIYRRLVQNIVQLRPNALI
jgi:capsid protein